MTNSAYIYEWRDKRWQLLLQSEQDDYRNDYYAPQHFLSVTASEPNVAWNAPAPHPPLILSLGYSPWCSSNWQSLYTRLWRASPTNVSPRPLIDATDTIYMGYDETAGGRIDKNDVLIEYLGRSVDGDVLVRPHMRHYLVSDNDTILRIAPVALNPRDFVDEWLTQSRTGSAEWLDESAKQSTMRKWHHAFHAGEDAVFGEFDDAPLRCRTDATLWQVGFTRQGGPKNPELTGYFLVRWMAPYRFTLVDIRKEKSRDCDIADPMRDNVGTLFPFN